MKENPIFKKKVPQHKSTKYQALAKLENPETKSHVYLIDKQPDYTPDEQIDKKC